jgi:hypothetical protein
MFDKLDDQPCDPIFELCAESELDNTVYEIDSWDDPNVWTEDDQAKYDSTLFLGVPLDRWNLIWGVAATWMLINNLVLRKDYITSLN